MRRAGVTVMAACITMVGATFLAVWGQTRYERVSATPLARGLSAPPHHKTSIPSVVVTIRNMGPSRGVFMTPPWIGIHDGMFDTYDGGEPASAALERLAEDGNTGPISAMFDAMTGGAPQATVPGPRGPFAPGDRASITLNVDPALHRYFSYVSMVIPSNDAFAANGNPMAHQLFDGSGKFKGRGFIVSGDESNDAGTETNDEVAGNVAFLNQGAPDTGGNENGVVVSPHRGFAAPGALAYPDGVLNYPVFGNGQFNGPGYRLLGFGFRFVDLGGLVRFNTVLTPGQEVQADPVASGGRGTAKLSARKAQVLKIGVQFQGLTGPLIGAHLHLGQAGTNGPVVVDMGSGIGPNSVNFVAEAGDLAGPLEGQELLALLNELAAGNVYINLHTEAFPSGEVRGQVALADFKGGRDDDEDEDEDSD